MMPEDPGLEGQDEGAAASRKARGRPRKKQKETTATSEEMKEPGPLPLHVQLFMTAMDSGIISSGMLESSGLLILSLVCRSLNIIVRGRMKSIG